MRHLIVVVAAMLPSWAIAESSLPEACKNFHMAMEQAQAPLVLPWVAIAAKRQFAIQAHMCADPPSKVTDPDDVQNAANTIATAAAQYTIEAR